MKKTLAILLALVMVFSSITVAFAEETLPADAKACTDLGMLVGAGNGVTVDYLKVAPTRIQAAVMVLRLKGLEATAKAFTGTDNFADANQAAWAAPIMAYLKANPQLGWIGNAGNFDPNGAMDAKSYYKVMLETLGYKQNTTEVIGDFTYANTLEFAATKGLVKVATATNFTVGDLATATIETLKATVKGSEKTLAASLVEAKVITEAAAIAAGLFTTPVVVLGVESVSATNLKEVMVVFNKAVEEDSAEDEDNYTIEINEGEDELVIDSAALQADGKSVLLTLDTDFSNGTNLDPNGTDFDLTVEDVEDTTGAVIKDTTVSATADDITAPVALGIKLTGPHTFEITFSEPIDDAVEGKVEVDGDSYDVATFAADDSRTVVVEMSDSELEAKDYKVKVSNYKDLADHKMVTKEFTLAYVKDTTAPTAKIVSADQTEVVVEFSEKVFAGDPAENQPLGLDYFYHSISSYHPDGVPPVAISSGGKKYTLTWATGVNSNPLPEGNVKFVVVYDFDDEVITDAWGNELSANIVLTASVTADTTKPTIAKVETDGQDTIEVYFSEDVNAEDAVDFENYTVLNADSEEQNIVDIEYTTDADEDEYLATITFGEDLEPGKYTIKVANIVDLALDENKIATATIAFDVDDETPPTIPATAIAVDGTSSDTIYIDFGGDMASTGKYSALDKENYQIEGLDLASADTVSFFNGDKSIVKITIADETDFVVEAGVDIWTARLADAAGNKLDELVGGVILASGETPATITQFRVVDGKTVEIRMNAHIKETTAASAFLIDYVNDAENSLPSGLSSIKSITWVPADGATPAYTKIIGILKAGQQVNKDSDNYYETGIAAGDYTVQVATNSNGDALVKSIYGTEANTVAVLANATDKFAPSLETAKNTGIGEITLTFTEALGYMNNGDIDLAETDLVLKNQDGDRLVPGEDYDFTSFASGDQIVILLDDTSATRISVETAANVTYIGDLAATPNKIVAFSKSISMDTVAPLVRSVTQASATTLVVTFSEALNEATAETVGNYVLSGAQNVTGAVLDTTGTNKIVTLTITGTPLTGDTLTINGVQDVVGNVMLQHVFTK